MTTVYRRSLDAIYPHLENIWDQILTEAILKYDIDISFLIRDMTSFYFEGECEESKIIEFGYSKDEKFGGKYILVSSYPFKSANDMLTSYKRRDKVEKRICHFKGPLKG